MTEEQQKTMRQRILEKKTEWTDAMLDQRIETTRNNIGKGFLTVEGALFLIANDLGLETAPAVVTESVKLEDVYSGMENIEVTAKILNIGDLKTIQTKKGSTVLLNVTLCDSTVCMQMVCWGGSATNTVWQEVSIGDSITITNCAAKANQNVLQLSTFDGTTIKKSDIEITTPTPKDVTDITPDSTMIQGRLENIAESQFYNKNSQKQDMVRMTLQGDISVVLWGTTIADLKGKYTKDVTVRLYGIHYDPAKNTIYGSKSSGILGGEIENKQVQYMVHKHYNEYNSLAVHGGYSVFLRFLGDGNPADAEHYTVTAVPVCITPTTHYISTCDVQPVTTPPDNTELIPHLIPYYYPSILDGIVVEKIIEKEVKTKWKTKTLHSVMVSDGNTVYKVQSWQGKMPKLLPKQYVRIYGCIQQEMYEGTNIISIDHPNCTVEVRPAPGQEQL